MMQMRRESFCARLRTVACRGGGANGSTAPGIQVGGIQKVKLQKLKCWTRWFFLL